MSKQNFPDLVASFLDSNKGALPIHRQDINKVIDADSDLTRKAKAEHKSFLKKSILGERPILLFAVITTNTIKKAEEEIQNFMERISFDSDEENVATKDLSDKEESDVLFTSSQSSASSSDEFELSQFYKRQMATELHSKNESGNTKH